MDAGSIFAEVVCVAAVLAGGAWVVWQMKLGRDTAVSDGTWQTPWGEVTELPEGAKRAAAKGGGEAGSRRPFTQSSDIAHRGKRPTP